MTASEVFRLRSIHAELSRLIPVPKPTVGEFRIDAINYETEAQIRRSQILDGLQEIIEEASA